MSTIPAVIVTGSSRGIGRGISLELAKKGYSVVINYAGNKGAAEEAAALCSEASSKQAFKDRKFPVIQADIGRSEDRKRLLSESLEHLGRIDALVNNAGIAPKVRADILEAGEESFEELIRVNLQGPYFLTQLVSRYWLGLDGSAPEPLLPGGFKVVFVSSISAVTASPSRGEYCVSKAGIAMTSSLYAARLADQGVQVYELRPGIMKTDMTSGVKDKYDKLIAEGLVPQKRWGTPEDIGKGVRALVDGDFAFSTGSVIYSDGGFNISRL